MSELEIEIRLNPGDSDAELRSKFYQNEIAAIVAELNERGILTHARSYSEKSASGATWLLGEFIVPLMAASSALWVLLGRWLQAKHGRKIRLKIGDIEAEATSVDDIRKLMEIAEQASGNPDHLAQAPQRPTTFTPGAPHSSP